MGPEPGTRTWKVTIFFPVMLVLRLAHYLLSLLTFIITQGRLPYLESLPATRGEIFFEVFLWLLFFFQIGTLCLYVLLVAPFQALYWWVRLYYAILTHVPTTTRPISSPHQHSRWLRRRFHLHGRLHLPAFNAFSRILSHYQVHGWWGMLFSSKHVSSDDVDVSTTAQMASNHAHSLFAVPYQYFRARLVRPPDGYLLDTLTILAIFASFAIILLQRITRGFTEIGYVPESRVIFKKNR